MCSWMLWIASVASCHVNGPSPNPKPCNLNSLMRLYLYLGPLSLYPYKPLELGTFFEDPPREYKGHIRSILREPLRATSSCEVRVWGLEKDPVSACSSSQMMGIFLR